MENLTVKMTATAPDMESDLDILRFLERLLATMYEHRPATKRWETGSGNYWLNQIKKDEFLAEYIQQVRYELGDETAQRTQAALLGAA